jgi:hypothetical protein
LVASIITLYFYQNLNAQGQFFKYIEDHPEVWAARDALARNMPSIRRDLFEPAKDNLSIEALSNVDETEDTAQEGVQGDDPLNVLILYGDDWTLKTLGIIAV